jgi:hypothetical protein
MKELKFKLIYNGSTTELTNAPDGWIDEALQSERDMVYFGLMRTFSIPLKFVKEGARILRTALYTDGIKANVGIEIYKRNVHTNVFELKVTGKMTFVKFNDNKADTTFECEIIEGGIFEDFKNKLDTNYFIECDGLTKLTYNGISSTFETVNQLQKGQGYPWYNESTIPPPGSAALANPLTFTFMENDFADYQGGYLAFHNYTIDFSNPYNPVPVPSTIYPIEILKDCKIRITATPSNVACYQSNTNGGWLTMGYKYQIYKIYGGVHQIVMQSAVTYITTNMGDPFISFTLPCDEIDTGTIDVVAGEKYYVALYRYFVGSDMGGYSYQPNDVQFWINWDGAISLSTQITAPLPEDTFNCMTGIQVFTELAKIIGNYPVKSDFLTNFETDTHGINILKQQLCFLGGFSIRKTATREMFLLMNLRKFIQFMRVAFGCGFGIEKINGVETMVIEEIDYFLNKSNTYSLPNNTAINVSLADELIYSEIKIGYNKYDYDDTFGLDEFNGSLNFKTPVTDKTSTLELISEIRADGAGIDFVRKMELAKNAGTKIVLTEKDTKGDNDVWCVFSKYSFSIKQVKIYESVNTYTMATGTTYPNHQVNYFLSPKRCLLRNGALIRSFLWGYSTEKLTYLTTENNPALAVQMDGEPTAITEIEDVNINTLSAALFYPIYFTFSVPGKFSIIDFIDLYAGGLFSFYYGNTLLKGIITNVGINMAYDQTSTIKLLSHISNDLTKLL